MPVTYVCPHCDAKLRTGNPLKPGRVVQCPKCSQSFTPVSNEAPAPEPAPVFKLADEPPGAKKPAPKPTPKPEPPAKKPADDDDDDDPASIRTGYGVQTESAEDIARIEAAKPKFGEVKDKFKRSARGPAMAMLVQPANLLTFEGFVTALGGIIMFVYGMWPIVFSELPPGPDEEEEAIIMMLGGLMVFGWGAIICVGAAMMQNLQSYTWAMVGSVMGILPLMAGIYSLAMLRNPRVIEGFEEMEGDGDGEAEEEEEEDDEDEDDDDDDDDEDED
jgi:hypothetical protein